MQRAPFIATLCAIASGAAPAAAGEEAGAVWHVAIFRFSPAHVEQAVDAFRTMRTASGTHSGNLAYDVFRSPEDAGTFFIYERWASPAALEAHEKTPVFVKYGRDVLTRLALLHDTVTGVPLDSERV